MRKKMTNSSITDVTKIRDNLKQYATRNQTILKTTRHIKPKFKVNLIKATLWLLLQFRKYTGHRHS
jgi:hypothetical protein